MFKMRDRRERVRQPGKEVRMKENMERKIALEEDEKEKKKTKERERDGGMNSNA